MDERIAKLPAWVRAEIERLRREVTDRDKRITELLPGESGDGLTGVVLGDYVRGDVALPARARVRWNIAGGRREGYIEVSRRDDSTLVVHGNRAVLVAPLVTNSIEIGLKEEN